MAYFPNGMSFCGWKDVNCSDCLNHRDNGSGSYGCAITDAHFLLANKMHDDKGERTLVAEALDQFIPDEGSRECTMRLTTAMLEAEERERNYQLDLERYQAAMAERDSVLPLSSAGRVDHG